MITEQWWLIEAPDGDHQVCTRAQSNKHELALRLRHNPDGHPAHRIDAAADPGTHRWCRESKRHVELDPDVVFERRLATMDRDEWFLHMIEKHRLVRRDEEPA